jgi:transcriptional regulator with XRE-family HTH domain
MSELGARLIRARETRGLTIEDAERDTRISRRYLQALEAEQFDAIPAPVYARGFLRSYSQYLGLDPQEMLRLFPRDDDPAYPSQSAPSRPSNQNPMSAVGPARPTWKRPPTGQESQDVRARPVGRERQPTKPEESALLHQAPHEPMIGVDIGVPIPARRIKADPAAQARTATIAVIAIIAVVAVVGLALLISKLGGGGDTAAPGLNSTSGPGRGSTTVSRTGTLSPGASSTIATGASGVPINPGTVPKVIDLPIETAKASLAEHKLQVRTLDQASSTVPKGRVIDQAPAAGSPADENDLVNLTVSKGPP